MSRVPTRPARFAQFVLCLGITLAFAVAWLAPATAAAAQYDNVAVGPIKLQHGWTVIVGDSECGAKSAGALSLLFKKGDITDQISHTYSSTAVPACAVSKTLGGGSLKVKWGPVLDLNVRFTAPGKIKKGGAALTGCTGKPGESRPLIATGTVDISIHPGAWGAVAARKAAVVVATEGTQTCTTAKPPKAGYGVDANFSTPANPDQFNLLDASETPRGQPFVSFEDSGPDLPAPNVSGVFIMTLTSKGSFDVATPNATIAGAKGFTTGSLSFTGDPACTTSPHSYNGSLSGTLTIPDPVLGNIQLVGSAAQDPFLSLAGVSPGGCDGPSYVPVTPQIDNSCSESGVCEASDGDNTDTFIDETQYGDNTIQSETVDFGDGTSAAIPTDGSVSHTYTTPGNYTATLTVTYLTGEVGGTPQTATAQTPVYAGTGTPVA